MTRAKTGLGLLITALQCMACLPWSATAHAFEGYEHKAMGDLAIQFVYATDCEGAAKSVKCKAVEALLPGKPGRPSYGDYIRCVDHFISPEKIFGQILQSQLTTAEVPWYAKAQVTVADKDNEFNPQDPTCRAGVGASLVATHTNHTHFQNDLLVAIHWHHHAALGLALVKGESAAYGALAMSAIAAHYAQDFYAPGHVVTTRSNLTDIVSNVTHDLANEEGVQIYLDQAGLRQAIRTLGTAWKVKPPEKSDEIDAGLVCRPGQLFKGLPLIWERTDSSVPPCSVSLTTVARSKIRKAIEELEEPGTKSKPTTVLARGDGFLWRGRVGQDVDANKEWEQGLKQRLLILAANVRLIQDVMQALAGPQAAQEQQKSDEGRSQQASSASASASSPPVPPTSLEMVTWRFPKVETSPVNSKADDAGNGAAKDDGRLKASFGMGRYDIEVDREVVSTPAFRFDREEYKVGKFSNIIGLQYGRESLTAGSRAGRHAYELNMTPFCFQCNQKSENKNITGSVGVVRLSESSFVANGVSGRIAALIPNTESSVGFYARRIRYPSLGQHEWKNSYGVRFDQGFTSLMTLFLAIGKDYGVTPSGALERGWAFTGGVAIGLPFSRVRGIVNRTLDANADAEANSVAPKGEK